MLKKMILLAIILFSGAFEAFGAGVDYLRRETDEITRYLKKEVIGQHTFIYQEEMMSGANKKEWFVDGAHVTRDEYEAAFTQAEQAWCAAQRMAQEQLRLERQKTHEAVARAGLTRLVQQYVDQLQIWLSRLADKRISRTAWTFSPVTIASEEAYQQLSSLIDQARALLRDAREHSLDEYKVIAEQLEDMPVPLQRFVYNTMQTAIEKSNDSQLLKELLGLLDGWMV